MEKQLKDGRLEMNEKFIVLYQESDPGPYGPKFAYFQYDDPGAFDRISSHEDFKKEMALWDARVRERIDKSNEEHLQRSIEAFHAKLNRPWWKFW